MVDSHTLTLIPSGSSAFSIAGWLKPQLEEKVGYAVSVNKSISLPQGAYEPMRKQYQGDKILKLLKGYSREYGTKVLGLIDADCFAEGLYYVFGQAVLRGNEAFIALSRLRQTFYGLPDNHTLFQKRVLKEAVHEIGHSLGLLHCSNSECVMYFSYSLHDTDIKGPDFCNKCKCMLKK